MLATDQKRHRESLLAHGLKPFIDELMLADPRYLIALVVLDMHASLEEIINEAAEIYFGGGFVRLGEGADLRVEWAERPVVVLDLVLTKDGLTCYFRLRLQHPQPTIELDYIAFPNASADPDVNSDTLERMLRANQRAVA